MKENSLVFVSFDFGCPHRQRQNPDLRTLAEYERMDDDTFLLLGLRCELIEGGACGESNDCVLIHKLPKTLLPEELAKEDFFLCDVVYEDDEHYPGHKKAVQDCKEQFRAIKTGRTA
jgi:hypothetical protein